MQVNARPDGGGVGSGTWATTASAGADSRSARQRHGMLQREPHLQPLWTTRVGPAQSATTAGTEGHGGRRAATHGAAPGEPARAQGGAAAGGEAQVPGGSGRGKELGGQGEGRGWGGAALECHSPQIPAGRRSASGC